MVLGILAVGLFAVGLLGFTRGGVDAWLPSIDLAAACAAMVVAFVSRPRAVAQTADLKGSAPIAVVLAACWFAALMTNMAPWITWLNLAFAFAFFYVSMDIAERKQRAWDGPPTDEVLEEMSKHKRDRWSA